MLLQFTVGNYRSFREKTTFSLVAEPQERPGDTTMLLDAQAAAGVNAVSLGVLYGANASGKSNLLKAIGTLSNLVRLGVPPEQPIPIDRFLLGNAGQRTSEPTFFEIYFVMADELFCYGMECDVRFIQREWLRSGIDEKPIFERRTDTDGKVRVENCNELALRSETSIERIKLIAESTRPNVPFVMQGAVLNLYSLVPICEWFALSLHVQLYPFKYLPSGNHTFSYDDLYLQGLGLFLRKADTGIEGLEIKTTPLNINLLTAEERRLIELNLSSNHIGDSFDSWINGKAQTILRNANSDELFTAHLQAVHSDSTGEGTALDWSNESEGTQRMAELWQWIFAPSLPGRTLFIDELERSLHPELVRFLIEQWREIRPANRQLIFTTHNDNLLEDDLLRRDEVWFVSKDKTGASKLVSEVQFKPLPGVTRQRAYLDGMYGGIPYIPGRKFYAPASLTEVSVP